MKGLSMLGWRVEETEERKRLNCEDLEKEHSCKLNKSFNGIT